MTQPDKLGFFVHYTALSIIILPNNRKNLANSEINGTNRIIFKLFCE